MIDKIENGILFDSFIDVHIIKNRLNPIWRESSEYTNFYIEKLLIFVCEEREKKNFSNKSQHKCSPFKLNWSAIVDGETFCITHTHT